VGLNCLTWEDCYLACPRNDVIVVCDDSSRKCVIAGSGEEESEKAETETESEGAAEDELDEENLSETADGDEEAQIETETEQTELVETDEAVETAEPDADFEMEMDAIDGVCYPTGANRAPKIEPINAPQSITAGETLTFPIAASDADPCDVLTAVCQNCSAGAVINFVSGAPSQPYSWKFSWTSPESDEGYKTFTINVSDSFNPPQTVSSTVVVEVKKKIVNNPPVIADIEDREMLLNDKLEFSFSFYDPENQSVTIEVPSPVAGVVIKQNTNLSGSITIDASQTGGAAGEINPTFIVKDSFGNKTEGKFKVAIFARAAKAKDCGTPIKLIINDKYTGNTADRSTTLEAGPTCIQTAQDAPQMFFLLKRKAGQFVSVQASPTGANYDIGLTALTAGCSDCVTGMDFKKAGESEEVVINNYDGDAGDMVVVVSGPSGSNNKGPFMIFAEETSLKLGFAPICGDCASHYDCGYEGICVGFYLNNQRLETSCARNCASSADCPRSYACKAKTPIDGSKNVNQCVPNYWGTGYGGYQVITCGAVNDLGKACNDTGGTSDEAECGADGVLMVDDCDCTTLNVGGQNKSICTFMCSNDNGCPPNASCSQGNCLPK